MDRTTDSATVRIPTLGRAVIGTVLLALPLPVSAACPRAAPPAVLRHLRPHDQARQQGEQEPKPAPKQEPKQEPQQESRQQRRAALQQSMKARYADLERLRDAGRIGETFDGFVAVVKAEHGGEKVDPKAQASLTVAQLAAAENDDRRALYALLAEGGVTAADVARQNAIRILDRAEGDHWFRLEDGRWVQKKVVRVDKKRDGGGDGAGGRAGR